MDFWSGLIIGVILGAVMIIVISLAMIGADKVQETEKARQDRESKSSNEKL